MLRWRAAHVHYNGGDARVACLGRELQGMLAIVHFVIDDGYALDVLTRLGGSTHGVEYTLDAEREAQGGK